MATITKKSRPRTHPAAAGKRLGEYFPNRFLKSDQFDIWGLKELVATISRTKEEEVWTRKEGKHKKLVLYLRDKFGNEFPNGYLIGNKTDCNSLESSTGTGLVPELPGKRIRIIKSKFRGDPVLRIDPSPLLGSSGNGTEKTSPKTPRGSGPDGMSSQAGQGEGKSR